MSKPSDLPNYTGTLKELVNQHIVSLVSALQYKVVALVVCAVTDDRFTTQTTINPAFVKDPKVGKEIVNKIDESIRQHLSEGLALDLSKLSLTEPTSTN